jgi:hypothetical protein
MTSLHMTYTKAKRLECWNGIYMLEMLTELGKLYECHSFIELKQGTNMHDFPLFSRVHECLFGKHTMTQSYIRQVVYKNNK